MTFTPAYKSTVRQFLKTPPINGAANDYVNECGVRVSLPCYVDLNTTQRKQLLNGVRDKIDTLSPATASQSASGLTVETATNQTSDVESYLGMTIDVLRSTLFSRGGLPLDLVLKLQSVADVEFITAKELKAALTAKGRQFTSWIEKNSYGVQATETSS